LFVCWLSIFVWRKYQHETNLIVQEQQPVEAVANENYRSTCSDPDVVLPRQQAHPGGTGPSEDSGRHNNPQTHCPIDVVEKLIEALSFRQIGVVRKEYAVSSDGMKMFGVMDLSSGFDGCRFHADCPIMPIIYGYRLRGGARGTY